MRTILLLIVAISIALAADFHDKELLFTRDAAGRFAMLTPSALPNPELRLYSSDVTIQEMAEDLSSHLGHCVFVERGVTPVDRTDLLAAHVNSGLVADCDAGAFPVHAWKEPSWESFRLPPHLQTPPPAKKNKVYPYESVDIMGNTAAGLAEYAYQFATHHIGPIHPFQTYAGTGLSGVYHLNTGQPTNSARTPELDHTEDAPVHVALAADWGAGTLEADMVQLLMMKNFPAHFTIHDGDYYYCGTPDEVQTNGLGIKKDSEKAVTWPHGSLGTFSLNGNHEMYARGMAYYDLLLPAQGHRNQSTGKNAGQKASFFMLQNQYWRVIGIDTGYNTFAPWGIDNKNNTLPVPHVEWLHNVANLTNPADTRALVFIGHHQYRSAWVEGYTAFAKQLAALVPKNRTVLMLWGHEHRMSWYHQANDFGLSNYARCVGNGGFPTTINKVPVDPAGTKLHAFDNRLYVIQNGTLHIPVGFNGFTRLEFTDAAMKIDYYTLALDPKTGKVSDTDSTLVVTETWKSDLASGNIVLADMNVVDKDITVVKPSQQLQQRQSSEAEQ